MEERVAHLEAQTADLHQRLLAREEELTRLTVAHDRAHAELAELQRHGDRRGPQVLDPTSMAPEVFGKPGGPAWRRWSLVATNYLGQVLRLPQLSMVLNEVAKQKTQPSDEEYDRMGISAELGSQLQALLVAKTDGDAAAIVEGTFGQHGAEAWRRLAARFDPATETRNLADRLQVMSPQRAKNLASLPAAVTTWETRWRNTLLGLGTPSLTASRSPSCCRPAPRRSRTS